jgi:membrane protein implicated in regulation of membrane protease activity
MKDRMMFSPPRLGLTLAFLLWSLLLLGGSGMIGWVGDGLAQLLANIHLGWLASIIASFGKLLLLILWLISAILFALGITLAGRLQKAASATKHGSPQNANTTTVTLERDTDGSYR